MSELPDGWEITLLTECVYFQEGPGLRKWQYGETGIPFLNIRTFVNGLIDKNKCQFIKKEEFENKYEHFLLNEGDIVVSSSGTIGKIAVIKKPDLPLMLNTSVIRFRSLSNSCLLQNYLKYYLQSQHFIKQIDSSKTGSAILNYGPSHLKRMSILIPPLNEQRRIVAKLEKLLAKIETCKQRLEKIPTILKRFRRSVLAAACSGRLTEDWREQNPDIEPAEELLKRILKSRQKQVTQKNNQDEVHLKPHINQYWNWTKLELLVKNISAGKNFTCPEISVSENTVGLVKISAVTWDKFNHKETKTVIDESKVNPKLFIQIGDFLISRANTIELVGASVVVEDINYKIMISDKVWRVDFYEVEKKYVNFYLKSRYGRKEIEIRATGSQNSMRNISQKAFLDINIPLPPFAEQKEIVRRVEALFKKADAIEQRYQKAKTYIDQLTQSILAKAFRGELVPQDPNDEPASKLLDRIRSEKAQTEKETK